MRKNEIQNVKIQNLETDPESPEPGQLYFNTLDKTLYVWNGTEWINALYLYRGEIFTTALKLKVNGIEEGATKTEESSTNGSVKINGEDTKVYNHPETAGNKHIPSGGASGQILEWSANGEAKWADHGVSGTQVITQAEQPSGHISGRCWIKTN